MVKKDKPATDKPVKEPKAEEPKAEKPASSGVVSTGGGAAPVGSDQHGRQLYNVKCAACGKQAQVPFKPSGNRPVYCRDCYMKQSRGGTGRGMDRRPRR